MTMKLYRLIGADEKTLEMCSSAEKTKFALLGSLILVPIVTATVAAVIASRYFTSNPLIIGAICLAWGLLMFVIERAMLASLRPGRMNFAAWFRVLVAVAMSAIVSELLVLALFKTDIDSVLARKHTQEANTVLNAGDSRINRLKAELAEKKSTLDLKEKAYIDEIDGRTGSGKKGFGPSTKAKLEALEKERSEYLEIKSRLDAEIAREQERRETTLATTVASQHSGLLESIATLNEMKEERPIIGLILWVLRVFLLGIELMPLVIRVSFSGQQYFDLVDIEDEISVQAGRQLMNAKLELKKLQDKYAIEAERLSAENEFSLLQLEMAGKKAAAEAQKILDSVLAIQQVETKATDKVQAHRLKELQEKWDSIFTEFLQTSSSILANPA